MARQGFSVAYKDVLRRRLRYVKRWGFDAEAFLAMPELEAEEYALAWLERREAAGVGAPALDHYARLFSCLARSQGWRAFQIKRRSKRKVQRIALAPEALQECFHLPLHGFRYDRAKAILAMAVAVGLRRSELAALRVQAVRDGYVMVESAKNQVLAPIPLSTDGKRAWKAWVCVRETLPGDHAFPDSNGNPVTGKTIYHELRWLGRQAGIDLNPTITRHTRGRWLRLAGYQADEIQYLMRHTDPASQAAYTEVSWEDIHRAVAMRGDPGLTGPSLGGACPTCGRAFHPGKNVQVASGEQRELNAFV